MNAKTLILTAFNPMLTTEDALTLTSLAGGISHRIFVPCSVCERYGHARVCWLRCHGWGTWTMCNSRDKLSVGFDDRFSSSLTITAQCLRPHSQQCIQISSAAVLARGRTLC